MPQFAVPNKLSSTIPAGFARLRNRFLTVAALIGATTVREWFTPTASPAKYFSSSWQFPAYPCAWWV